MQKSLTWVLLAAAILLSAFIFIFDRRIPSARERAEAPVLYPDFDPAEARELRVAFASGEVLRAEKMNGRWILRAPEYPAQQSAIENFLTNVARIRRLDRLAQHEVTLEGAKSFGLDPPRASVQLNAGTNLVSFELGARAPLTNNVYLRLRPSGEVVLASAGVDEALPRSALAWRDPRIVDLAAFDFDKLRIHVGPRSVELARNATNRQWQITRPVPVRADQERISGLFEILRGTQVAGYVTDLPTDLERFGLQNPEVELLFLHDTNRVYAIEFGAPLTNAPGMIHARLLGNSNIVAVPIDAANLLRQPYKNFHETQLVELQPGRVDRVMISSIAKFTLQRGADGKWIAEHGAEKLAVDPLLLNRFFTNVLAVEILDIAKEVPTEADLKSFGLQPPKASYSFFERLTNATGTLTNIMFTDMSFGVVQGERIFARRSDELPVYATEFAKMFTLPREPYELRERTIWSLPASNIVRVTIANAAGSNVLQRSSTGLWSPDPITHEAISEAVLRLAKLEAAEWSARGDQRKAAYGFGSNPMTLSIELRGPQASVRSVQIGNATPTRNVYAMITLPGETVPLIFEFPGLLFYSLIQLLPVPQ